MYKALFCVIMPKRRDAAMKKVHKTLEKAVAKAAIKAAGIEENTTCWFYSYQPKRPKGLKRLRKF